MSNKPQPVRQWTLEDLGKYWEVKSGPPVDPIFAETDVKVLEAAPTMQLIDKLQYALEFYSVAADEVYAVNVTTLVGFYERTIDRGEKAEELLIELRKWKDGLK